MQPLAESEPSSPASNFAGFLAALTAPAQKPALAWNEDDLEDDIATINYEQALRAKACGCPTDTEDRALTQTAGSAPVSDAETISAAAAPATPSAPLQAASNADVAPDLSHGLSAARGANRKCSSVTIRLSKVESAQLHQRAAEAGLTVSAYLRSCTFEAESLRAQVKEVLAQLRSASSKSPQSASVPSRHSWFQRSMRA
jgi:hypothetical protein